MPPSSPGASTGSLPNLLCASLFTVPCSSPVPVSRPTLATNDILHTDSYPDKKKIAFYHLFLKLLHNNKQAQNILRFSTVSRCAECSFAPHPLLLGFATSCSLCSFLLVHPVYLIFLNVCTFRSGPFAPAFCSSATIGRLWV